MHATFRSIAAVLALLFAATVATAAELEIVTTTTPLASLLREIGGDAVEVQSLTHGAQDPHYATAKPSLMRALREADGLVYNGLQLEVGWLPLLLEGSRNPNLRPGSRRLLDASAGLTILELPTGELSRAQGDIHPEGNPHFWLDPRNALPVAERIAAWLAELAPDRAATFNKRLAAFRAGFDARVAAWEQRLSNLRGARVVAYHKQWEYLADWLDLSIVGYVEDKPGIPPSPRHVHDLEALMRAQRPACLLVADFTDPTTPHQLSERTGVPLLVLPTAPGSVPGTDTLAAFFDHLVAQLTTVIP